MSGLGGIEQVAPRSRGGAGAAEVAFAEQALATPGTGYFLKSRITLTSADKISSFPLRSGFGGMAGLLPTAGPPSKMSFLIWSSVTAACHWGSANARGFGTMAAAPGPSPAPWSPWQTTHFILKRARAS